MCYNMKKFKKVIPLAMAIALSVSSLPLIAQADNSKVVTLGADLSDEQKVNIRQFMILFPQIFEQEVPHCVFGRFYSIRWILFVY